MKIFYKNKPFNESILVANTESILNFGFWVLTFCACVRRRTRLTFWNQFWTFLADLIMEYLSLLTLRWCQSFLLTFTVLLETIFTNTLSINDLSGIIHTLGTYFRRRAGLTSFNEFGTLLTRILKIDFSRGAARCCWLRQTWFGFFIAYAKAILNSSFRILTFCACVRRRTRLTSLN